MGPKLMELLRTQAERFGTSIRTTDVTAVDLGARPFRITAGEDDLLADTLIIATGASAKWLGIPSEDKFRNYGVSACATCDGALFKGREVLVVGGGDTAMEEANYLTHHASKVTVIHRREDSAPRASCSIARATTPRFSSSPTRSSTRSWGNCPGRA